MRGRPRSIDPQRALAIGPGSGRVTVTGNNFSNSFIGEAVKHPQLGASGIHLDGAADVSIVGNVAADLPRGRTIGPARRAGGGLSGLNLGRF